MAKNPVTRDTVKKLIDALTPMNPETAEKFMQELLRVADERRRDVERVVGDVAKVGVRTAEGVASTIQHEWSRQLTRMASRIDDLERQVEALGQTLESTRTSLVSLAARNAGKGAETNENGDSNKTAKSVKKAAKKAEKKAAKKPSKKAGKKSTEPTGSNVVDDSGSTAVPGI
jgi:polyhydroxyalkanoate synthesis regulator phasin